MCKVSYFVQATSYTASISILTVISVERYVAIIHPMRSRRLQTMFLLRATVVGVWMVAGASGVPYLLMYHVHQLNLPVLVGGLRPITENISDILTTASNINEMASSHSTPCWLISLLLDVHCTCKSYSLTWDQRYGDSVGAVCGAVV